MTLGDKPQRQLTPAKFAHHIILEEESVYL